MRALEYHLAVRPSHADGGHGMSSSRSLLDPPPASQIAQVAPEFGQRSLLTVDTEEEFDWEQPFKREGYGLEHVPQLERFQQFCEGLKVTPLYLIDWPIVNDPRAVEIIGDAIKRGTAEVGVQLHPWVNPPFDEVVNDANSYAGNLPRELEAAKFESLRDQIETAFGQAPLSYRAGRYGLGPNTLDLIKRNGIRVDTSVRSLFDYRDQEGPDYSNHPLRPYWADEERTVLELPVTSTYWGLLRKQGSAVHQLQRFAPTLYTALPKLQLLERIALTPEGVTAEEAIRGIDIALDDGLPLLVLSFHSPSLAPGHTPYAETDKDVDALYAWFEQVYTYLNQRGIRPTSTKEVLSMVT